MEVISNQSARKRKAQHRHEWKLILPLVSEISPPELRAEFWAESLADNSILRRSVQCVTCGVTGHKVPRHDNKIKVHRGDHFLKGVQELAKKYSFKLPFERKKNHSSKNKVLSMNHDLVYCEIEKLAIKSTKKNVILSKQQLRDYLESALAGAIKWSVEEFEERAKLREGIARKTLFDRAKFEKGFEDMIRHHDTAIGINWEVIDLYLDLDCRIASSEEEETSEKEEERMSA